MSHLLEQHAELIKRSAISPEVLAERSYSSITVKARLAELVTNKQLESVRALADLHSAEGTLALGPATGAVGSPPTADTGASGCSSKARCSKESA